MGIAKFKKAVIDIDNKCEACSVFDVNNDGVADIVCGEYWYEGPSYGVKHKICDITYDNEYIWDFSDYPMDVNGDGFTDIVTGSWWDNGIFWRENPGAGRGGDGSGGTGGGEWATHKICDATNVETIRCFDIDGDGIVEIFPNCPGEPVFYLKLITDGQGRGAGQFEKYVLSDGKAGHGIGFGDIDGDGNPEIIFCGGILHMPKSGLPGKPAALPGAAGTAWPWDFTPELDIDFTACVPILVYDVNGDGLQDLIVGAGHNYGLFWYEQQRDGGGKRTWAKHVIDAAWSQYHDMQLIDIDGDGELELLTGKRWRAHNGRDPGDSMPVFICYYSFDRERQKIYRHIIEYGDPEAGGTGVGIYFWTADLTGNGKPDIVAPGKEGLYILYNS
ncbi:MAG: VCBS repeat-containing protein [Oscillospiraceae bacterium]|nr:VCBS repeat-containing protein [Oscillospiraceae bacterium]